MYAYEYTCMIFMCTACMKVLMKARPSPGAKGTDSCEPPDRMLGIELRFSTVAVSLFEWEMPPVGSLIGICSLQLVALFGGGYGTCRVWNVTGGHMSLGGWI